MAETLIAGRYRLDSPLAQGGMSEVWSATDLELDRRVALKLLAPNEDNARFEREARAVAALAHPNVTQLYDYGESGGRPFMVFEYLPGGTLEQLLRARGRPDDEDTRMIAYDIAAGLAHAHDRGVVHRDLKPSNVLFDEEGRAKLADFGIARMAAGRTLTDAGTVMGTAAYISPEQAAGLGTTAASDVYSFGVLLFRMLTGRLPFESDDPLALVLQHRDAPAPLVGDVRPDAPPDLAATADAALAKDPRARPADGAALLDALGEPTPAPLPYADDDATRVLPSVPKPRRRSRVGLAFTLAVLLLLALAGGVLAYEITRPAGASLPPTPQLPATTHRRPTSTHAASTRPAATTRAATATESTTTQPATTKHTLTVPPPVVPRQATTTAQTTTLEATTTPTTTAVLTTTTAATIDTTTTAAP